MRRSAATGPRALVRQLGGHPARGLGIPLGADGGVEAWFVAACVLAERAPSGRGTEAVRALDARGMLVPRRIAAGFDVSLG